MALRPGLAPNNSIAIAHSYNRAGNVGNHNEFVNKALGRPIAGKIPGKKKRPRSEAVFYTDDVGLPFRATVVPTSAGPANRLFGPANALPGGRALLGGTEDEFLLRRGLPHRRVGLANAQIAGFVTYGINRAAELTSTPRGVVVTIILAQESDFLTRPDAGNLAHTRPAIIRTSLSDFTPCRHV